MEQNLQKLFRAVSYQPESRLSADIWALIETKRALIIKRQRAMYLSFSILSLSGSIWSIKILATEFINLGFFDYFSLIFSDSGLIANYWKEYTLSLADSLPVASIFLTLSLLLILAISIRRTLRRFKYGMLLA